jgi:hypothetical protein
MKKIWQHYFADRKTYHEMIDFYSRTYPYLQDTKMKKFLKMYYRAEAAMLGVTLETLLDRSPLFQDLLSSSFSTTSKTIMTREKLKSIQQLESAIIDSEISLVSEQALMRSRGIIDNDSSKQDNSSIGGSLSRSSSKSSSLGPELVASSGHFGTLRLDDDNDSEDKGSKDDRLSLQNYFANQLFCICQQQISDTERYIACVGGTSANCNGWVHLSCAGFSHLSDSTLRKKKYRDYRCQKCAVNSEKPSVTDDENE